MFYFGILLLLLYLSFYYDIMGKTTNRGMWYNIILAILIILAGMRYRVGVDTTNEVYAFYHETPTLGRFFDDFSLLRYPLWEFLNSLVYTLGGRFYLIQFIEAAFVNILVFRYFNKHSSHFFTCVFFYFVYLYASFNFEEMKASFSAVLCLFANDYILEKKWGKGFFLYLLGCLFHISTVLIIPLSLFMFLRLNKIGIAFLALGYIMGVIVEAKIEDYLYLLGDDDFVADKIDTYANSDRWGSREAFNIIGVTNRMIGFLFPMAGLLLMKWKDKGNPLLRLEPLLLFCFLFMLINLSIPIFYRYSHFYDIYYILFVSYLFVELATSRNMSRCLSYTRSLFVFLPCFIHFAVGYSSRIDKFYPYSSIIERKVYKSKEKKFNENRPVPDPKYNEY